MAIGGKGGGEGTLEQQAAKASQSVLWSGKGIDLCEGGRGVFEWGWNEIGEKAGTTVDRYFAKELLW